MGEIYNAISSLLKHLKSEKQNTTWTIGTCPIKNTEIKECEIQEIWDGILNYNKIKTTKEQQEYTTKQINAQRQKQEEKSQNQQNTPSHSTQNKNQQIDNNQQEKQTQLKRHQPDTTQQTQAKTPTKRIKLTPKSQELKTTKNKSSDKTTTTNTTTKTTKQNYKNTTKNTHNNINPAPKQT